MILRPTLVPVKPPLLSAPSVGGGTHLIAEWYECDTTRATMLNAGVLRMLCLRLAQAAGLQIVGDAFHQFLPHGVTGTVLLAESHLAIHTWPETGFVTLDVYVCNYLTDNSQKAFGLYAALEAHFQPVRTQYSQLLRGAQAITSKAGAFQAIAADHG